MLQLPFDLQNRVRSHLTSEQLMGLETKAPETTKLIHVPMQTFPPTAMVYSVPKPVTDSPVVESDSTSVPLSLLAKVLSPVDSKRRPHRTHLCVKCREDYSSAHKETQTGRACGQEGERTGPVRVHRKVRHQSLSDSSGEYMYEP